MIELENALIATFANITKLNPDEGQIRVAYAENPGPAWKHTDDVLSFSVTPISDAYAEDITEKLDYRNGLFNRTHNHTNVVEVNISIYGPHSRKLASSLYVLIQNNDLRSPLTAVKAYPVLKTPQPRYVPYEHNKQWWNRTDLTLRLNWFNTYVDQVNPIESVPIGIYTDKGDYRNVDITSDTRS